MNGKRDPALHPGDKAASPVAAVIEVKGPKNPAEMLTPTDLNRKAFQQQLLYYLEDRTDERADNFRRLVVTTGFEWYIFDAQDFYRPFVQDRKFHQLFREFKADTLQKITTTTTVPTGATSGNVTMTTSGGTSNGVAFTVCAVTALARNVSVALYAGGNATVAAAQVNNGSSSSTCGALTLSVLPSACTCANVGANAAELLGLDAGQRCGSAAGGAERLHGCGRRQPGRAPGLGYGLGEKQLGVWRGAQPRWPGVCRHWHGGGGR